MERKLVTPNCEFEFGKGSFDDWCVYRKKVNGARFAPRDSDYFRKLAKFGDRYGRERIYRDLESIYRHTGKEFSTKVGMFIYDRCVERYGEDDGPDIAAEYITIYMGMVAELNKEHTVLGSRVKMLGLRQVLLEGMDPKKAAAYSRGRSALEISCMCDKRGIPEPPL